VPRGGGLTFAKGIGGGGLEGPGSRKARNHGRRGMTNKAKVSSRKRGPEPNKKKKGLLTAAPGNKMTTPGPLDGMMVVENFQEKTGRTFEKKKKDLKVGPGGDFLTIDR